jgi:hypothetical protein
LTVGRQRRILYLFPLLTFTLVDLRNIDKMMYIGAAELTIYTVAIALSKISFGLTLLRLTDGWTRLFVYFAISTLAIFAVPATIIPWVQCKPLAKTFVDFIPGTCGNKQPSVVYGRFQASKHTASTSVYLSSLTNM